MKKAQAKIFVGIFLVLTMAIIYAITITEDLILNGGIL